MEVERRIEQVAGRKLVLELPKSFENRRVEVIVLTLDDAQVGDEPSPTRRVRRPHPSLVGKATVNGDIFDSTPMTDFDEAK